MLTRKDIENANPKEKRYTLFDTEEHCLRVWPTGAKTWVARTYIGRKIRQKTIGTYPEIGLNEARRLRREWIGKLEEDVEEQEQKQEQSPFTFGDIAEKWLIEYSAKQSAETLYNHKLRLSYVKELNALSVPTIKRA